MKLLKCKREGKEEYRLYELPGLFIEFNRIQYKSARSRTTEYKQVDTVSRQFYTKGSESLRWLEQHIF